jgi:hypothetical protein
MAKTAFSKNNTLFTSKLEKNLRKKLVKCYIYRIAFYGVLGSSQSRSEITGKF